MQRKFIPARNTQKQRNYRKQPYSLIAAMVSFVSLKNRDDADNSFSDFDTVGLPLQWCMIIIQGLCLHTHIESWKGQGTIRFDGNFWFFGRIDTLDHTINTTIRLYSIGCVYATIYAVSPIAKHINGLLPYLNHFLLYFHVLNSHD